MAHTFLRTVMAACFLLTFEISSSAHASETQAGHETNRDNIVEEVLVVGRRPGPPLWRVTNGHNTLWVFGTLSPLPKELVWDNSSVTHIISEASHFITPPGISATASNPFKVIPAMRQLKKLKRLPKGQKLSDVVPAELLKRFESLSEVYGLSRRRVDYLRPIPAAEKMLDHAYKHNNLRDAQDLTARLAKMAKRGKLITQDSAAEVSLDEILQAFEHIPLAAELKCFESILQSIAQDQQAAITRANAWAEGDAERLLRLDYPEPNKVCNNAILSHDIATTALERSKAQWLQHAEDALTNRRVTLTSLPMTQIADPQGLLAQLEDAGYELHGQSASAQ